MLREENLSSRGKCFSCKAWKGGYAQAWEAEELQWRGAEEESGDVVARDPRRALFLSSLKDKAAVVT